MKKKRIKHKNKRKKCYDYDSYGMLEADSVISFPQTPRSIIKIEMNKIWMLTLQWNIIAE